MNDDNNLDLLDLDDSDSMDSLPDATPFAAPRPKKPWLLLGVGVLAVVLSSYIIVRVIGEEPSSAIEVDLDAPVVVVDTPAPVEMNVMPAAPAQVVPEKVTVAPQPAPVAAQPTAGVPVRVVEERKEVVFKPAETVKTEQPVKTVTTKPVAKPKTTTATQKTVAKKTTTAKKTETKSVDKPVAGAWYVQFGSYSSRAAAESAQRQIANAHKGLFMDKQFLILAAQLKDGKTTYRLRVAFKTAADANGFCRNAKSDGLDCYVAK